MFFQLYVIRNRTLVTQWVMEAESYGFKALIVTVDAPRLGKRERAVKNRFKLPPDLELSNLKSLHLDQTNGGGGRHDDSSDLMRLFASEIDASLTWEETIPFLKSITKLPIIIKGILSPLDARLAVKHSLAGVVVSNHGGRQLDSVPSAIEMLPEIVKEVKGKW